jgi:hypothetical protein
MYNRLIDSYLSTRPKNRFFSVKDTSDSKESILSGGCEKNILTLMK